MPRFEPVDHDPFAPPRVALMPVDNDPFVSPEDAFAYGQGISPDATWRNLLPAAELGLGLAPGSGEAMSARDAWDASGRAGAALTEGNFGDAASEYLNMGTGLLGAIPGAGIVARGTKRGAAWMDRNLPEGFNRLLDSVYPSDPRSTTFSGVGPTDKPMSAAEFDRLWAQQVQSPTGTPSTVDPASYLNPERQYLEDLSPLPKRSIRGPSGSPNRPRKETEVQVYHGTTSSDDFPKFDPHNFGASDTSGKVYLTDHPAIGSYYADPDIMKKLEDPNYRDWERPRVMPSYLDTEGFAVIDARGKPIDDVEYFEDLRKQGYKGVVLKNVLDVSGPHKGGKTPFAVQNQYVTWTPGTLRSSISEQQLYNAAPYIAAPAISYGLYGASDDEQGVN